MNAPMSHPHVRPAPVVEWAPGDDHRRPLGEHLRRWAAVYGDRIALVDRERRTSFLELDRRADRLAAALDRAGLRAGDRALVQLPNGIGFVTVCFALFRIGVIPVMAMPAQRARDIRALWTVARPTACFLSDSSGGIDLGTVVDELVGDDAAFRLIAVDGAVASPEARVVPLAALDAEPVAFPPPHADDTALLLLSGGTTATPKLIPRTHADYAYNFIASARLCGVDADSVGLAVLPIAHNFALACPGVLGMMAAGGRMILLDTASCDEAMPAITAERVTHVALVPSLARLWVEARAWEDSDLSSLRLVQVGGARMDAALARDLRAVLGTPVQQVFGMAEGLLCYTRPDDPEEVVLNSQGRPLSPDDDICIVDTAGQPVPEGDVGELLTRGPYTIRAYYNASAQDPASFTADGFYRTGDLVRRDRFGNLVVEGRIKEQINRGGEKIAPAEIEAALLDVPGIDDAVVVGVPDTLRGERICAFVRGTTADTAASATLVAHLRAAGLSEHKIPDQFETLSGWPLTAIGKVDKQRLVAIATERHAAPARYLECEVAIQSAPIDLAVRIADAFPDETLTLYERDAVWSLGIGSAIAVTVTADGSVSRSDGRAWRGGPIAAALSDALQSAPVAGWRAYGRADFELAHVLHGTGSNHDDPRTLLRLHLPRIEVRLRTGTALLRALDPTDLTRLTACISDEDAMKSRAAPVPIVVTIDDDRDGDAYRSRVAAAVEEMHAGACRKVILSRAVDCETPLDMAAGYRLGRAANTPARSFLLRDGGFQAYGFSPETVVEVDAARHVSTQPLAGTRALGDDEAQNARLADELHHDAKEIAEHAVSVKLALEELEPICTVGTAAVTAFMEISRRGSVQHLGSRVGGTLRDEFTAWDAFVALFPAVTASGIGKRAALDSIARHEGGRRGLYSGCVMIADQDGALDAALVLRSVFRDGQRCWLRAGAGIVPLSTPEREWTETCEKLACVARHLYRDVAA